MQKWGEENLSEKVDRLIKKVENMSVDELEAWFNQYGYYPKRKDTSNNSDEDLT